MGAGVFPVLILNALPAAGKSEIIAYLKSTPLDERADRFHIGPLKVLDDFPMLWTWFEEDDLLERVFDRSRLHTTPEGYFVHADLWHLLVRRLSLEYEKLQRDLGGEFTTVIEFSRGKSHGGYAAAYQHLSSEILTAAAALYVRVSFSEALRKNRARRNPNRPDSILEHSLSDQKMRRLYHGDDWDALSGGPESYLSVHGIKVPQVVLENHDDVTTSGGEQLGARLEARFNVLWDLWQNRTKI
jgi:hypothetical protein